MDNRDRARRLANLNDERDGSALYAALSEIETDPNLSKVYAKLAAIEAAHAQFWARGLDGDGIAVGRKRPSARTRLMIWFARRLGPAFVLPAIAGLEAKDSAKYDRQRDAVAAGLPADERSHARLLSAITSPTEGLSGPLIARIEGRHRASGGNALRAAVLGANDGLLSNLSLVMGVAGAATANRMILITGLAGLIAGACSMALGEWLSVTGSRELYARQIETERSELEASPEEEREELALIYTAKGLPESEARILADRLMSDHAMALDALAREELGIDPDALGGSAFVAASTSFFLFAAGAIFPVLPFFFLTGPGALLAALAASAIALAAIGAITSLFTGRGLLFSAARQVAIGAAAAGLTFGVGRMLGASITG